MEDELKKKQDKLASKKLGSLFGDDDDDDESSGSDTDAARKAAVAKPPAVPAASAAAAPTPAASAPVAAPKAAAAAAPVAAANAAPVPAQQKPAADFEDVNLEKVISLEKLGGPPLFSRLTAPGLLVLLLVLFQGLTRRVSAPFAVLRRGHGGGSSQVCPQQAGDEVRRCPEGPCRALVERSGAGT